MSKSLQQWESYIGSSLKKTAEATLETAQRISKFKSDVEPDQFKLNMKEWFGFSATHISYWNKIHDNMERFQDNIECIPASTRSLYELSSMDDDLWNEVINSGDINPSLTVEDVKNLKLSGGIIKKLSAKYSDAHNYLDICNKLKELKRDTDSVVELKKEFATWLKENPADWIEDEEAIDGEYEEVPTLPKSKKMSREVAYSLFGIHMDSKLENLEISRLLRQLADNDELEEAIEVITK